MKKKRKTSSPTKKSSMKAKVSIPVNGALSAFIISREMRRVVRAFNRLLPQMRGALDSRGRYEDHG